MVKFDITSRQENQEKPLNTVSSIPVEKRVIMVTGYSGAGKKTLLQTLEDHGFYCVDNMPLSLGKVFIEELCAGNITSSLIALGVDVRTSGLREELEAYVVLLRRYVKDVNVVFVACSRVTVLRRYQETRRKHPLAISVDIEGAIEQEYQIMSVLRDQADLVINTDELTMYQLRDLVIQLFKDAQVKYGMVVQLTSFGFKYGVPHEPSFVFDVRTLPNPYFEERLKNLDGEHDEVVAYLFNNERVIAYWNHLNSFITYLLQESVKHGRYQLSIAIGCTGGRHRSVAIVNKIAQQVVDRVKFIVIHRDIMR